MWPISTLARDVFVRGSCSYVHTYVRQEEGQQNSPEKGGGDGRVLTKAERAARVHNKAERASRFCFIISNFKFDTGTAERAARVHKKVASP